MARSTFRVAGENIDVVLEPVRGASGRYVATIGDRTIGVEVVGDTLRIDGQVHPVRAARDGDEVFVWTRDGHRRLDVVERTARRSSDAAAAGASDTLIAPMPGTILKINVSPGDDFEADATLVIMESMKMEMSLSQPAAGHVADVCCAVGDLVEKGAVLVRLASES